MFNAFTVCDEYLERSFVAATKMIVQRLLTNGTTHNLFAILAVKENNPAIEIVALLRLREHELSLIDHTQYRQNAYNG